MKKLKYLILGAGLCGSSAARLLKDAGQDVVIFEKEEYVGGLCITRVTPEGIKYEPFGARTFHTHSDLIRDFVLRFDEFNGYVHRKGIIINHEIFPFPLTWESINRFPKKDRILEELQNRPQHINMENFETAAISVFGRTLFKYFVKNCTEKMWGMDPADLIADWAPKRLELRQNGRDECFPDQWQGLPCHGYSVLIERIIGDIPVVFKSGTFDFGSFDVIISSARIDEILNFKYGKLRYRSLRFDYEKDESWEQNDYGTINLPQHPQYIRKCNFKILHKINMSHSYIQYQEPVEADDGNVPMYPVATREQQEKFMRYLEEICQTNICPIGRLGLFKYLDMDKAIMVAFDMLPVILKYHTMTPAEKLEAISNIIRKY